MTLGFILNTRPAFYHLRFHDAFGDLPWAILDCPTTYVEPLSVGTPSPEGFDAVIFTSQMGVATFSFAQPWFNKKVYAVGQGTAEAAAAAGFTNILQTGYDVEDMCRCLADETFKTALYPSGDEISADLAQEFPGRIHRISTYRMVALTTLPTYVATPALQGTPIIAPLFSRRGARILSDILGKSGVSADNAKVTAVGISANVFADGAGPWHRQMVADEPTLEALAAKSGEAIESLST